MDLIQSLLVIWAIVFFGVACQRRQVFSQVQVEGFEVFLFKIALPCYLFTATINNDLSELLDIKYMASYLLAFIFVAMLTTLFFYKNRSLSVLCVKILTAGYVNAGIYALPVISFLLKDPTAGVLATLLQVVVIQSIFVTILSFSVHKKKSIAKKLLTTLSTPLIMLPAIGLFLNYIDFSVNFVIATAMQSLAGTASSLALFIFGLTIGGLTWNKENIDKKILLVVFIKNIVHPIVAFCVGRYIFHLESYWLYSLVMAASAPTAFVVYFIAKQFSIEADLVKRVVAISAITSLFSLAVIIYILG